MSQDRLTVNGVDGASGEYLEPPRAVDELVRHVEAQRDANLGTGVPESDVKLAAFAILRAGGELQAVHPRSNVKNRIVVGYTDAVASEEPLTAKQIDGLNLSDLQRPLARQIGSETEGTVAAVDAEKRTGTINWNGEKVTFRLALGARNIAVDDIVRFEVFQTARDEKYAVHIKRIAMDAGT